MFARAARSARSIGRMSMGGLPRAAPSASNAASLRMRAFQSATPRARGDLPRAHVMNSRHERLPLDALHVTQAGTRFQTLLPAPLGIPSMPRISGWKWSDVVAGSPQYTHSPCWNLQTRFKATMSLRVGASRGSNDLQNCCHHIWCAAHSNALSSCARLRTNLPSNLVFYESSIVTK